jgi:hypothetical protein
MREGTIGSIHECETQREIIPSVAIIKKNNMSCDNNATLVLLVGVL